MGFQEGDISNNFVLLLPKQKHHTPDCQFEFFFETIKVGINGIFVLFLMQIICQQLPIK